MKIDVQPGTYVVAVSGGVDSMVLLDLLVKHRVGLKLVVAHFDHGMRPDSYLDRQLVQSVAAQHNLPFVYDVGKLGAGASEALARKVRYEFLYRVRKVSNARAIITAHHQDDVIETAVLQLMRGTGRKGLSSLQSHPSLLRPLLHVPKKEIKKYAKTHDLLWREDVTNSDTRFARNYVRQAVLPRMKPATKKKFMNHLQNMHDLNKTIDELLTLQLHTQASRDLLDRHWFIDLPHAVSTETLAAWLRSHGIRAFNRKLIERLVIAAKTYAPGQTTDVNVDWILRIEKDNLALAGRDR